MELIKKSDKNLIKKSDKNLIKKEFLISELQRFYRENSRVPVVYNMQGKFGYPNYRTYTNHFDSWNEALKIAGLKVNYHKFDGTEICSHCNKKADEIHGFTNWFYDKNNNNKRHCNRCGSSRRVFDYKKGELDGNSKTGRGRLGEIIVVKALEIGNEHDCALISYGYPFDMYYEKYGKVNVKTSVLSKESNQWVFHFDAKKVADTYICIGKTSDTKHVKYVWIVSNEGKFRDLQNFSIYNTDGSLKNHKKYEVDKKIYDNAWQEMLENYIKNDCDTFLYKGD